MVFGLALGAGLGSNGFATPWFRGAEYVGLTPGGTPTLPLLVSDFLNNQHAVGATEATVAPVNFSGVWDGFARASSAYRCNSAGILVEESSNTPRINFDLETQQPLGILMEEAGTNICLGSHGIGASPWTRMNITSGVNSVTAPDGTLTGTTLTITSAVTNRESQTFTVTENTSYVFTFYAKAGTASAAHYAVYNNTGGSFIVSSTNYYGQLSSTKWRRITVLFTTPAGCTSVQVYCCQNTPATGTVFVWGADCKVGTFATSLVRTTSGATATRASDFCLDTGFGSSPYNATENTFLVDFVPLANHSVSMHVFNANDGTASAENIAGYIETGTNAIVGNVNNGSVTQAQITVGTAIGGTRYRMALASKLNDFAGVINGGTVGTDVSGTMPVGVTRLDLGNRSDGNRAFSGHIRRIAFYGARLSNASMQGLTV